jgi:hypothetical protein
MSAPAPIAAVVADQLLGCDVPTGDMIWSLGVSGLPFERSSDYLVVVERVDRTDKPVRHCLVRRLTVVR